MGVIREQVGETTPHIRGPRPHPLCPNLLDSTWPAKTPFDPWSLRGSRALAETCAFRARGDSSIQGGQQDMVRRLTLPGRLEFDIVTKWSHGQK